MPFLLIKIVVGTNTITYIYNATGQKVSKIVNEATNITQTNYLAGGFQYQNNVLQFFPHAEGYVKHEANNYSYVFNYTDHLGNIRLSYSDIDKNGSLGGELNVESCETHYDRNGNPYTICNTYFTDSILEENHYYPFGLKHTGYNMNNSQPNYQYKYNHREWQGELGLNVTAMDFRQYDPAIGRFNVIDVMTDIMPSLSPYRFAFNNPILWNDPSGMLEGTDPETDPTIILKEVVVTGKSKKESLATRPANFTYNLIDWSSVDNNKRPTLEQYNKHNGTNYQSFDDYYYNEHYKPAYNQMIGDIHGATGQAATVVGVVAATLVGTALILPVLVAAAPTAQSFIAAELTGYTTITGKTIVTGMASNALSQGIANGGDVLEINVIEVGSSAIPGVGQTIIGETFNLKAGDIMNGNFTPTTPQSFDHALLQIGGGLLSNYSGNKIDNFTTGNTVESVYKEVLKFTIETGSNVAPGLADK